MNKETEDIKVIREMMEKSTKFLSLSGLSGIVAGITAILGAAFAYFCLLRDPARVNDTSTQEILILLADALFVLLVSVGFGIYFSWKKARKNQQKLFNSVTKRAIYNLALPLAAGGIFSFLFLLRGDIGIVMSSMLLFYGMALLNVSKYTFEEIHYLGITEIILGLLAAVFPEKGILFWAGGFGLCHIIYGWVMYVKYDNRKK